MRSQARAAPCLPSDDVGIAAAAERVAAGEVIAYPTETVYGLGADALDPVALGRLVAIKGRESHQPISVLVQDEAMLRRLVQEVHPAALELARRYWPGPLTLVLLARSGLPEPLINERGGVGVRISSDPVAAALVRAVGRPLTATSANRSGEPAAHQAQGAALEGVTLVLDGGPRGGTPSTVVEALGAELRVLRAGAVTI
ncbi:MAG: threonylcarbamoyl-AMP synthase [Deltaproteobacteria bacterium]|nr:threonylcarbamoyl-AMP synthase [Deltaproteobacteria bacterium]